jgi:hypothetical protein
MTRIRQRVNFATYELPPGFIGWPSEGIAGSDEAQSLSSQLASEAERQELASTIGEYNALIVAYLLAH